MGALFIIVGPFLALFSIPKPIFNIPEATPQGMTQQPFRLFPEVIFMSSPAPRSRSRHHILFQGQHYKTGYAHKLRSEKYFIIRLPNALHAEIHSKSHDIPTPNGYDCKRVYLELQRRLERHQLSNSDSFMQRLSFLIEMWENTCPATTAILKWQRDIAGKFYAQFSDTFREDTKG